jgi:hypothetical protein
MGARQVTIEDYSHKNHFEMVSKWLTARKMPVIEKELFSDCGYVVDSCAVGFLMKTNSGVCYIDHIAGDPDADSMKRSKALDLVCGLLEKEAFRAGYKMIMVLANLSPMMVRFQLRGYADYGKFHVFHKAL